METTLRNAASEAALWGGRSPHRSAKIPVRVRALLPISLSMRRLLQALYSLSWPMAVQGTHSGIDVFTPLFSRKDALSATNCPRCNHEGLLQIEQEEYASAPTRERHAPKHIICPSLYVRCPICRVVAEWPDCRGS